LLIRYQYGFGVPLDKKTAVHYYQLAAAQSYPRALCNLAEMYLTGEESAGISFNLKKAILYFILAADQEYERANTYLARSLLDNDRRKLILEYLSELWPTLTMTKTYEFKNPLFQKTLTEIFQGEGEFTNYTSIAQYQLMKEWPNSKAKALLHPTCKAALITLALILKFQIKILPELIPLMLKSVIGLWQKTMGVSDRGNLAESERNQEKREV